MNPKVLVIDDDKSVHRLIQEESKDTPYVESLEGVDVVYASSGQEGIDMFMEYKPALVLLDMHMPGLDGLDVTKKLITLDHTANIFLLTRYADEERTMLAIEEGARGFINKSGAYIAAVVAIIVAIIKIMAV